jgi:hypothetical protein
MDLVGIFPSPKETEDFVNDKNPKAYDVLIDRLLRYATIRRTNGY